MPNLLHVGDERFELSKSWSQTRWYRPLTESPKFLKLVAGPGVEPSSMGYEPIVEPFYYPASVFILHNSWWRITESNCCEGLAKAPGSHYINPPNLLLQLLWCPGSDSNRHTFRYQFLRLARLPITPPRLKSFSSLLTSHTLYIKLHLMSNSI